jgi:serine protease Do
MVTRMSRGSGAYRAGIEPGDIIVSFNGQKIDDPSQLQRLIQDAKIGSTARIAVIREGREVTVNVPIQSTASRGAA